MNNNFKILYFDKLGLELDTFLRQYGDKLKNQRIFYLVSARMDVHKVFKLGISERGENSAFGRLKDYVHNYGVTGINNPCEGVKIYVCLANTYNVDVDNPNSGVRRLETQMKRDFKYKLLPNRGNERTDASLDEIFEYLDNKLNSKDEIPLTKDIEKPTRKTPRLKEKNQGANDTVDEILEHIHSKSNGVLFTVRFKKSRQYDSNQNSKLVRPPDKRMTYDELILSRNGKEKVDKYIEENISV